MALLAASGGPAAGNGWNGKAVLRDATGAKVGTVRFEGDEHGTTVKVVVAGVAVGPDAFHGLHIHANPNKEQCNPLPKPAFSNVMAHWSPSGARHGHHEGDLPSLLVQGDGTGWARSVTARFDPGEIDGLAVVLHADPDNGANIPTRYSTGTPPVAGPDTMTYGAGDSGERIACGIIDAG